MVSVKTAEQDRITIFQNPGAVPFLALIAVCVWGAAYPFIKLGLLGFGIASADTAAKTLFAGLRFTIAGGVLLMIAAVRGLRLGMSRAVAPWVLLYALVNTALHYFFFYIGVSNSAGSRAAVLNSLGTFMLVFLSCAIFPEEHLTRARVLGCMVGFSGLLCLNLDFGGGGSFTLSGDGMIVLNAVCSAFGGILTRIVGKKTQVFVMTGYGLLLGGLMLVAAGLGMGGHIRSVTAEGVFDLLILVLISAVGFSVYNQLLQYHPVGRVAIFSSLIPVFGIVFSCLLLREAFTLRYVFAALLVTSGIFIINREK